MSDQEEEGKKGKKQKQKRRGKKPEVSELGRAEPQQNSVLSDTGTGQGHGPLRARAGSCLWSRGADMDSGVLQVEILKAKRGRDKDKEEEGGEGEKKKKKRKRKKDKADKDRERVARRRTWSRCWLL